MKKKWLLFLVIFLAGCVTSETLETDSNVIIDWKEIVLEDVSSGDEFKISDFSGRVVLIESFAVWCPTCKRQQDRVKELHELLPEVVSISLDTDPNEDAAKVLEHVNQHGYDWRFAVAPVEMTQSLIDEFSLMIVNAPGAPVVLICQDGSAKLLPRGVKSADDLKGWIERC